MASPLFEEIKTMILSDIEIDARECANTGSALYCNNYHELMQFKWDAILTELIDKQTFLAEVLMAVAYPVHMIGNSKKSESLVSVLSTVYGILMKRRFKKLSLIQKVVSIALANEHAHQKKGYYGCQLFFFVFCFFFPLFIAHLSTKCSRCAFVITICPASIVGHCVHRQPLYTNNFSLETTGPNLMKFSSLIFLNS
jgi:hypothetical protein